MTRPSHHALLLALGLACTTVHVAASAAGSRDEAQEQAIRQDDSFQQELIAAAEQVISGDSLGAAIAYERLLADPRLETLEPALRSEVWARAAIAAGLQGDDTLADDRLRRALEINPDYADARVMLANRQLSLNQLDAAADNMIRAIGDGEDAPTLEEDQVWFISMHLRKDPARRQTLLQALFDHNWKPDGVEPSWYWVDLAELQVASGQLDRVAATLERVDEPLPLIQLRSDKRFDRFIQRGDPRFDPVAAAQRYIDRMRVETMLSPGLNEAAVALANALLITGQAEDVVGMTQSLGEFAAQARSLPEPEEARPVGMMLNARARAFWQLGRNDEAIQTQELATRMASPGDDTEQKLRLASSYTGLHRPALARQTLRDMGELSVQGEGMTQVILLQAAQQLADDAAQQQARSALAAVRPQAPAYTMLGLVTDHRLDEAAAVLAERLADPLERGSALLELQQLRERPELPGDKDFHASWKQFKARADVIAAAEKVGRIERYALYSE